jgi:hypothetical protein
MQHEFSQISPAIDNAAKSIPTLGSALSKVLDKSFFEESLAGPNFLDTSKLVDGLRGTELEMTQFFTNVQTITEAGASDTAAALLALGPDNLGARVAAEIAANEPLFRDAMEKALSGIANAELASEATLNEMRARITFLSKALGTDLEEQLKIAFGTADITQIQTPQLVAFFQRFPGLGGQAATDLVDAFNREIVAKRIIGFDTKPVEDGIAKAKEALRGANLNNDVDVAIQAAQAAINDKAPALGTPIPKALTDIKPEVIGGIGQIGDIIVTGTVKTKDEYDAEFKKIVGITKGSLDRAGKTARENTAITEGLNAVIGEAVNSAAVASYLGGLFVGKSLADGTIEGIYLHRNDATHAAEALAASMAQAAAGAVEATSPSKVFMRLGRDMVRGLVIGVDQTAPQAVASSRDMALGMTPSLGGGFGAAPIPSAGASPFKVQVVVDSSMLGGGVDNSISVGAVHNYGPDIDSRGRGMIGVLRDLQFTGGSV